jgi:hypothetical protein
MLLSTFVFFLVGFVFVYISLQTPSLFSSITLSISLHVSMYLTILNSISINISLCPYVCLPLWVSLFLYPPNSISICDCVYHSLFNSYSFSVLVCLINFNWFHISISFVYTTFLSPFHIRNPSMFVFSFNFSLSLSVSFWFFFLILVCDLLLASSMVEPSLLIQNCNKNLVCRLMFVISLYPQ